MLQHEDEMFSRPARTWFQTEKEKKSAAAAAAAAAAQGKTVMEMEAAAGESRFHVSELDRRLA
jgi:ATP-dependent RNA helicase DDX27